MRATWTAAGDGGSLCVKACRPAPLRRDGQGGGVLARASPLASTPLPLLLPLPPPLTVTPPAAARRTPRQEWAGSGQRVLLACCRTLTGSRRGEEGVQPPASGLSAGMQAHSISGPLRLRKGGSHTHSLSRPPAKSLPPPKPCTHGSPTPSLTQPAHSPGPPPPPCTDVHSLTQPAHAHRLQPHPRPVSLLPTPPTHPPSQPPLPPLPPPPTHTTVRAHPCTLEQHTRR